MREIHGLESLKEARNEGKGETASQQFEIRILDLSVFVDGGPPTEPESFAFNNNFLIFSRISSHIHWQMKLLLGSILSPKRIRQVNIPKDERRLETHA